MTTEKTPKSSPSAWLFVALSAGTGLLLFGLLFLLTDIFEKKREAYVPFAKVVEVDDQTEDPAIWGKNFPQHYESYSATVDMERTRFGGSEAVPRDPTADDPRDVTSQSKLEQLPHLKRMWAGYSFAIDFREERGHAYMLEDQTFTKRQTKPMPGTCLNCHASLVVPWTKAGKGDLIAGYEKLNPLPYAEARKHVETPIACIDCHEPKSMQLRVTRPAFMAAIAVVKKDPDYDVNTDATHQEMRTFVCAQCHVEYYFDGKRNKRLVFPWNNGLRADEVYSYYEEIGFADWTHKDTGARAIKAQHPEYEMWSQGIHARSGVSCADCHMPYRRQGAQKLSDHQVRSPMLNVDNACRTCHPIAADELVARVDAIQERNTELRDLTLDALVRFIDDIKAAKEQGMPEEQLNTARAQQRKAGFLLDFVEAENSGGFHAPQEAARVLGLSLDATLTGQLVLRDGSYAAKEPHASAEPEQAAGGAAPTPATSASAPARPKAAQRPSANPGPAQPVGTSAAR